MNGGDKAVIKGGSYSTLGISTFTTKSPAVTFQVASGETANASGLGNICTSGVVMDGTTGSGGETGSQGIVSVDGYGINNCGHVSNVTIKGVYTSPNNFGVTPWFFRDCDNVTIQDVTIDANHGDTSNGGADAMQLWTNTGAGDAAHQCNSVTLNRLHIYDYQCPGTTGDHQDGIQMMGGDNFVMRNSKIVGMQCLYVSGPQDHGVMGLFMSCGWGTCHDPIIENNLFANVIADDGAEVALYYADDMRFVNNTVTDTLGGGQIKVETGVAALPRLVFANNVTNTACASIDILHGFTTGGGAWANNVLSNNCGYGDAQYTGTWNNMFVSPATTLAGSAAGNWGLASGSFAIDKGSATYATATDYQGGTRGGTPDAGFDEFGAP